MLDQHLSQEFREGEDLLGVGQLPLVGRENGLGVLRIRSAELDQARMRCGVEPVGPVLRLFGEECLVAPGFHKRSRKNSDESQRQKEKGQHFSVIWQHINLASPQLILDNRSAVEKSCYDGGVDARDRSCGQCRAACELAAVYVKLRYPGPAGEHPPERIPPPCTAPPIRPKMLFIRTVARLLYGKQTQP